MPSRRNCRTSRAVPAPEVRLLSARDRAIARPAEEEPIRRWPHPVSEPPAASTTEAPAASAPEATPTAPVKVPSVSKTETPSVVQTQMLEQLNLQSQLLVDILAAINGLTAAVLAQSTRA